MAVLIGAAAARAADPALGVVVHVTDHAGLDAGDLARAQAEARRIFADSGVRLVWTNISEGREAHACDGMNVSVALLSPFLIKQLVGQGMGETVLGSASPSAGRAFVYSERVYARAEGTRVEPGVLLGRVVAHEVGHLLLGGSHSRFGLMTTGIDTDPQGLRALFSSREARTIRGRLRSHAESKENREVCGGPSTVADTRK
jgi:hypothetical protein